MLHIKNKILPRSLKKEVYFAENYASFLPIPFPPPPKKKILPWSYLLVITDISQQKLTKINHFSDFNNFQPLFVQFSFCVLQFFMSHCFQITCRIYTKVFQLFFSYCLNVSNQFRAFYLKYYHTTCNTTLSF